MVDLLVYQETILRGRKVYLDFTRNPGKGDIPFERLSPEAYDYLKQAGALFGTPIERLRQMNEPAISFYRDHKVDLYRERLEVAVCAQHNNGGISTDAYWETRVSGLFAVGEVCGSHGVTRPGGSALNAGQAGAVRAAEKIHLKKLHERQEEVSAAKEELLREEAHAFVRLPMQAKGSVSAGELWKRAAARMSACAGMIRNQEQLERALKETEAELNSYLELVKTPEAAGLPAFYRLRDMLLSQKVYLFAMLDYAKSGAGSRGSALYTDETGKQPDERLPRLYRCTLDMGAHKGVVQEVLLDEEDCFVNWRPVRPIPQVDYFFENQWKAYRDRNGI